MKNTVKRFRGTVSIVVGAAFATFVILLLTRVSFDPHPDPVLVDLSGATTGSVEKIPVGRHEVSIVVPEGEGFSFGTMNIEVPAIGFISFGTEAGVLPRLDGPRLEAVTPFSGIYDDAG